MRRLLLFAAVLALLSVSGALGRGASAEGPPLHAGPEHLALGDSLSVGVGASDTPPFPSASEAYVPLFHAFLADALDPGSADPPPLEFVPDAVSSNLLVLENLGVGGPGAPPGGETTDTMISGGQLDEAVSELTARNGDANRANDVRVVTLDIGGNDMFPLFSVCDADFTPSCKAEIARVLRTFAVNFETILGDVRTAAGPDTTIIVMTYYNALVNPGCLFNALAPAAEVVLEGEASLGLPLGLNDLIRAVAGAHGAKVAEAHGRLGPADIQPDCRHANDGGYAIIAEEFIAAFED